MTFAKLTTLTIAAALAATVVATSPADAHPYALVTANKAPKADKIRFNECVVGIWARVRTPIATTARLELHYPRYSSKNYRMSYYMWFYKLVVTPQTQTQITALASRKGRRTVWIGRNNPQQTWQLASAGSCPIDESKN